MNVENHDFIEIDYTGKFPDGKVFDTTIESIAKENDVHSDKVRYSPAIICIGEKQVLPGLDAKLLNKEIGKEHEISLTAEEAFGKRDVKKMRIVPISEFQQHKVQPQPGLQIDMDGEIGVVSRVSGGRVIVNFNHPFAGRDVVYTVKIIKKITEPKEQITSFMNSVLRIPKDSIKVDITEKTAKIGLPVELPAQVTEAFSQKLTEITELEKIEILVNPTTVPESNE
ncbi:MAG: peptidylprolyl isomerase [Nanoarchaeota archaeon]|nr:peptidylprolyl isomerase [Nanoarchaeota archaeon]|tara:strand:+ start:1149 stop:1826 length:678 start_codon:yes stop_codon:yes gene_type:complete